MYQIPSFLDFLGWSLQMLSEFLQETDSAKPSVQFIPRRSESAEQRGAQSNALRRYVQDGKKWGRVNHQALMHQGSQGLFHRGWD